MQNTPIFSLAYTTVRPKTLPEVIKLWNERSRHKTHEWVVAVDDGDTASAQAGNDALREAVYSKSASSGRLVVNTGPKNCVAGWNCAAAATQGKVIICVSDDFLPPYNWDELLLGLKPQNWINEEHVIKVADGYVGDIFVLSILTRKRYDRFGYVFYPSYISMFCDTEFGEVATRDGVVIEANHLLFEHLHPDCGKRQRDESDLVHASKERWRAGEMLFNLRKSLNFPQDAGPKAVSTKETRTATNSSNKYVAYLQVTKDDICLFEVCQRLADEGVRDFAFCQPDRYWSGEPVLDSESAAISSVVQKLTDLGHTVHHKLFHVEQHQVPGDSRIEVETRVRNASLDWIRSLGYRHVLVVDGDELWVPGTLDIVKSYVDQGHQVITVGMIPVVGFPGYPVEGATDVAVVYVSHDVKFKCCRSPFIRQSRIPRPLIYHFTGTRRTLEETVLKHRRSGHYDDPEYGFEEWIQNTLPRIAPGLKGAHMYKPYQIWPSVRAWRPDELESMPQSVRPYLGTQIS